MRLIHHIPAVLAAVWLAACTSSLELTVTNATGADITVTVDGTPAVIADTHDATYTFDVTVPPLATAVTQVTASWTGAYRSAEGRTFTLNDSGPARVTVTPDRGILALSNASASDTIMSVFIDGASTAANTASIPPGGTFLLTLPAGTYSVRCEGAQPYIFFDTAATVTNGTTLDVQAVLMNNG